MSFMRRYRRRSARDWTVAAVVAMVAMAFGVVARAPPREAAAEAAEAEEAEAR